MSDAVSHARHTNGHSGMPIRGIIAFVAFCAVLPIALVRFLPINDYPFHLARIIVLDRLDDPVFDRFYDLGSFLLPNLGMDVVALALALAVGPEIAARMFVALTILTPLIGVLALHRAMWGRLSVWPLLATAFLYNGIFIFGFFNYLFGLGLAFIAAAVWLVLQSRPARLVTGFLCSIGLMYCHMSAFGVFAVIVGGIEIHRGFVRWREGEIWGAVAGLCFAASPFILAIILFFVFSPTAEVSAEGFGYASYLGAKPLGFLFSQSSAIPWLDALTAITLAGLGGWLVLSGRLTISKPLAVAVILLSLVFVVMPASLMGSHFADTRLGPAISLLVVAAINLRADIGTIALRAVTIAVCALAIIRAGGILFVWTQDARQIAPIVSALEAVEPGAILFAATAEPYPRLRADTAERRAAWRPPLKHVASYAVLDRPVFVPMTFADPTKQPIVVAPDYADIKKFQGDNPTKLPNVELLDELLAQIAGNLAAGVWPDIGAPYLLVLGTDRLRPLTLPSGVSRVSEGERYMLLRIAGARAQ